MLSESDCSKKFKKICDKAVTSTEKEVRLAKEFSKLWNNYSAIQNFICEESKKFDAVDLELKKQTVKVELLKEIDKNREEELQKVKDDIKELEKKIASLRNNEAGIERKKAYQQKLLEESVLKQLTRTYISDDHLPNLIRGFTASVDDSKVIPFEIDTEGKTSTEIADTLWENAFKCSPYAEEWENIFKT